MNGARRRTAVSVVAADEEASKRGRFGSKEIGYAVQAAIARPEGRPRFRRELPEGVCRGGRRKRDGVAAQGKELGVGRAF